MAKDSRRNRKSIEAPEGFVPQEIVQAFLAQQEHGLKPEIKPENPDLIENIEEKQKADFVRQILENNQRLREIVLSAIGRKLIPETRLFEIINKIRSKEVEEEIIDYIGQTEPEQSDSFIELDILVDEILSQIIVRDFQNVLNIEQQTNILEKEKLAELFWAGECFSRGRSFLDQCAAIIVEEIPKEGLENTEETLRKHADDVIEVFREKFPDFPLGEEAKEIIESYLLGKIKK